MNKAIAGSVVFLLFFAVSSGAAAKQTTIIKTETAVCGIENCHGADVICGPHPAEMCTMMYAVGDGCRQFAKCEIINGKCQLNPDPKFEECRNCIKKCLKNSKSDPASSFGCESQCLPAESGS